MKVASCTLLFILLSAVSATSYWNRFANGVRSLFQSYEEAPYSMVRRRQDFEVRRYLSKKWVCTDHTGTEDDREESDQFWKLFNYINGRNVEGVSISMTIPVSVEVSVVSENINRYRMCFYLGRQHQNNPPTPTEAGVFIENRPEKTIIAGRFGGYPDEDDWQAETNELKSIVETQPLYALSGQVYRSTFQSPMKFWNRRQEVWLVTN